jgi:hypothetical protein
MILQLLRNIFQVQIKVNVQLVEDKLRNILHHELRNTDYC